MSYFQPDKATTSGMSFIIGQRERWKQLVANATVIGIIGVRVRSSDNHIWDALQHTKAKLVYCSGLDGGKEFLEWKQHVRPSSGDKAFYGYFKESFDDICVELNIKTATQQSVHWTGGFRRHFRAFFWRRVFPASKQDKLVYVHSFNHLIG